MTPKPRIHESALVHPTATLIGDVTLGPRVSVWPGAVLRGDIDRIEIGEDCTIQDLTIIHCDPGIPTIIGKRVGVGHRALLHSVTIEDDALIGMGAILLTGCRVATGSIIGAGAVCPEGMQVPTNSLVVGVPGRIIRQTTAEDRARIRQTTDDYLALSRRYHAGEF